jgi:hypothetical protein
MGQGCSHRFIDVKDVIDTDTSGYFYKEQMGRGDCIDCPEKNISVIRSVSKIAGTASTWRPFDPSGCTHPTWDIHSDTIRVAKEQTFLGTFARLFTGPGLDGIQYHRYLIADAQCKRCGKTWDMRSDFTETWVEQKLVNIPTAWKDVSKTAHMSEREKRAETNRCNDEILRLEKKKQDLSNR